MTQRTLDIILIDDELAAEPREKESLQFDREKFLSTVGRTDARFWFCDALNPYIHRHTLNQALQQARAFPGTPDLIIVDMMFGEDASLGLHIVDGLRSEERFESTPLAMMSTRSENDTVSFVGEAMLLSEFLTRHRAAFIPKAKIFQEPDFWRAVRSQTASGRGDAA